MKANSQYIVDHPFYFFFFNDTATTEIYTLSLHDALPIPASRPCSPPPRRGWRRPNRRDRKSTRLNSSHVSISYAVFCLKKKTENFDYSLSKVSNPQKAQSYSVDWEP